MKRLDGTKSNSVFNYDNQMMDAMRETFGPGGIPNMEQHVDLETKNETSQVKKGTANTVNNQLSTSSYSPVKDTGSYLD